MKKIMVLFLAIAILPATEISAGEARSAPKPNRQERVQAVIESGLADLPPHLGPLDVTEYEINALEKDSGPILAAFVVDESRSVAFRLRALALLKALGVKPKVLEPILRYIHDRILYHLEPDMGLSGQIKDFLSEYYQRTGYEPVLEPFRRLLERSGCDFLCKRDAIQFLMETGSEKNISLFRAIVQDHGSPEAHRVGAAYGLAKAGDGSAMDFLIEVSNFLFDTTLIQGHLIEAMYAIQGLVYLSKKHPEANEAIQQMALRYCQDQQTNYIYRETMRADPIGALGSIGGKKNIDFLMGTIIPACSDERIVKVAILTLGRIGTPEIIKYLSELSARFPEEVRRAIEEIEERHGMKNPEEGSER